MNNPGPSSSKKYSLTKQFGVLSVVFISIVTVALWVVVSYYLTKEMLDREWEITAAFVRKEARKHLSSGDLGGWNTSAVAKRFDQLSRDITMMPGIARIKLYNSEGVIVWSDEKRLIGNRFDDNPDLARALDGLVVAQLSPVAKGENLFERDAFPDLIEVYVPIFSQDSKDVVGVIETYKVARGLFQDIHKARLIVLLVALAGGGLLYVSLFAIVRRAARKINEQQSSLLKMHSELMASQRLAEIGEMAAAVAHGIRNPLSSIRAAAQLAQIDCADPTSGDKREEQLRVLKNIIREVDRVEERVRGLLNFVRPLESHVSPVDVNLVAQDVVRALRGRFESSGISLRPNLHPDLPKLNLDPAQLEQIFIGVLTNAIEATPRGGEVTMATTFANFGSSRALRISIEDTGEGIPAENREQVFTPFFTTKPHGTGIGLSLTKKFVERNGGTIVISHGTQRGTRVEITFPISGTAKA